MNLNDDDIAALDAHARGTPAEFTAFLDEATGRSKDDDPARMPVSLAYHPEVFRTHLNSNSAEMLLAALTKGEIMDRVVACLRLLQMPAYVIPPEAPLDLMQVAQRHLSQVLVDHPALMHNRIWVKGLPLPGAEFGPIATIIGLTARAELPRLCHGVDLVKLGAFARHHCVLTGLTKAAPAPRKLQKPTLQGLTLLGACSAKLHWPRPRLLTSIMELDGHRGAGMAESRRPSSFLVCRGRTEQQLRTCVANTFLAALGIFPVATPEPAAFADFLSALKTSGIVNEGWFLEVLEANLYRWASLPANCVAPAFIRLGQALIEFRPNGLAPTPDAPTPLIALRWLVQATLDSSTDRAADVGLSFKNFPSVDTEHVSAFMDALEHLEAQAGAPDGLAQTMVSSVLSDRLESAADAWRAGLRVHLMQKVIQQAGKPGVVALEAAEAPAQRRARVV